MSDPYEVMRQGPQTPQTADPYSVMRQQTPPPASPPAQPQPSLVQRVESTIANAPGIKQAGDVLRQTWLRPVPVVAKSLVERDQYTRNGLLVDEAGNVYDQHGHQVMSNNLQNLLTATIPAGAAPGARAAQGVLQRVAPKIVPREGGLIREAQPVRQAVERGVGQLTGVPVKAAPSAAQSATEMARAGKQGLTVLHPIGGGSEAEQARSIPPVPKHETIGPPGSVLAIRPENAVNDLSDGLYQLRTRAERDRLIARKIAEAAPKQLHSEDLYHFDENPSHPIAPFDKQLYDKYIKPLADEADAIMLKLGKRGVNPEEYTPRFPVGRGNMVDRIVEGAKAVAGRAGLLSKSAPQFLHRKFKTLVDEAGNRTLAYINDGKIAQVIDKNFADFGRFTTKTEEELMNSEIRPIEQRIAQLQHDVGNLHMDQRVPAVVTRMTKELEGISEKLVNAARMHTADIAGNLANKQRQLAHDLQMLAAPGASIERRVMKLQEGIADLTKTKDEIISRYNPLSANNKVFTSNTGARYSIGEARTTEIEANTNVRYHKDVLVNRLVSTMRLREAERASDFIEQFKQDPTFKSIAAAKDAIGRPAHFIGTRLDQFRNYVFEPKIAHELDKYARSLEQGGGVHNILESANRFLRSALFFNFLIHTPNIGVHWAVERGALKFVPGFGYRRLLSTGARAFNAIAHQNEDYLYALDQGAAMKYAGVINQDLHKVLMQKAAVDLSRQPALTALLQRGYGIANPVKALYNFSNKVTWFTNDLAILQRTYERMETHGEAFTKAFHEVERGIPNYRIAGEIFNSPALAKFMSGEGTMFGNYHYGMLRAWGEIARDIAGAIQEPRKALEALDRLAMAGILWFAVLPKVDAIAQRITNDPTTVARRAGALSLPEIIYQFRHDEVSAVDGAMRLITPGIGSKLVIDTVANAQRTGYIGDIGTALRNPTVLAENVKQTVAQAVAPVGLVSALAAGGKTARARIANLLAFSEPRMTPADRRLATLINDTNRTRAARVKQLYASGNTSAGDRLIEDYNTELETMYRRSLQQHGIVADDSKVQEFMMSHQMKPPRERTVEQYQTRDETPYPERIPTPPGRVRRLR